MKPSQFNVFLELEDGQHAIYQTATGQIMPMPESLWHYLQRNRGKRILPTMIQPRPLAKEMVRKSILVPADRDEIQSRIFHFLKERHACPAASVTVIPTHVCNLTCYYCAGSVMTQPQTRPMTLEMVEGAVRFIRRLALKNHGLLHRISFYGGEPLMNAKACSLLMTRLHAVGKEIGSPTDFVFVTNGTRVAELRDEPAVNLANTYHITLDGARHKHNQIRKYRNGDGSYDKIMAGIGVLAEKDIGLVVRIHSNEVADDDVGKILDDLEHAGLRPDSKAVLFFGTTTDVRSLGGDTLACMQSNKKNQAENRDRRLELVRIARQHRLGPLFGGTNIERDQIRHSPLPVASSGCVYGTWASAVTIDSDGQLFPCPDAVGMDRSIGRIDEQGRAFWRPAWYEILAQRWWNDTPCAECECLPVCMGGCPLEPRRSRDDCESLRQGIHDRIAEYGRYWWSEHVTAGKPTNRRSED